MELPLVEALDLILHQCPAYFLFPSKGHLREPSSSTILLGNKRQNDLLD